jgi:hypothetical protein
MSPRRRPETQWEWRIWSRSGEAAEVVVAVSTGRRMLPLARAGMTSPFYTYTVRMTVIRKIYYIGGRGILKSSVRPPRPSRSRRCPKCPNADWRCLIECPYSRHVLTSRLQGDVGTLPPAWTVVATTYGSDRKK